KADKERKEQQAKAEKERKEKEAKAEKERKELQAKAEKERKEREAARARALLEGKSTASVQEKKQRFVIQIGAFSDAQSARQERMKAERAGVKTYIQIIKTREGEERTRVRAGPYTSREEADKAAATLKSLGLPSAVQTL
ncbi:MAG: SPOR domain-containing protein, partial [Rhodocyclaceae bacterium]|nr:SPOR domain-containing protein [Rhodocyclaceae bacterium]